MVIRLITSHRGTESMILLSRAFGARRELPERLGADQGLRAGLRFISSSHSLSGLGMVKCHTSCSSFPRFRESSRNMKVLANE